MFLFFGVDKNLPEILDNLLLNINKLFFRKMTGQKEVFLSIGVVKGYM